MGGIAGSKRTVFDKSPNNSLNSAPGNFTDFFDIARSLPLLPFTEIGHVQNRISHRRAKDAPYHSR
ncbi:MAG: hypothetical protein M2R45_05496 [Verrucomicrobia subdivision 3 bacterium]|nr:hypothetical protein [Limisphaerales bacterium]